MAAAGGSSAMGAMGSEKAPDVGALLRNLRIGDDDFDYLVIDEDISAEEEHNLATSCCSCSHGQIV
jgi:hypothetical protein